VSHHLFILTLTEACALPACLPVFQKSTLLIAYVRVIIFLWTWTQL
jgi:hypothetical protein